MDLTLLISGFLLGAGSSLHCIGMCGPLALMAPASQPTKKITATLAYHSGRISTYMLLGLVFGLAGRILYLSGIQQWISIVSGILLIIFAGTKIIQRSRLQIHWLNRNLTKFYSLLAQRKAGVATSFFSGTLNGLLPCGMVYLALGATLSFSHTSSGIAFMAMFGIGTLPTLLLFVSGFSFLNFRTRLTLRKLMPAIIAVTGTMLILRGLDLNIAYLSPHLPQPLKDIIHCF